MGLKPRVSRRPSDGPKLLLLVFRVLPWVNRDGTWAERPTHNLTAERVVAILELSQAGT